jgi:acetyltransferase
VIYGIVNLSADPEQRPGRILDHGGPGHDGLGLGNLLMRRIIDYARARGIGEIYGEVLQGKQADVAPEPALGFAIHADPTTRPEACYPEAAPHRLSAGMNFSVNL